MRPADPEFALGEQSIELRRSVTARRDSVSLVVASLMNGATAYAIVVAASRSLNDTNFAAFSVAWSLWALSVALLVFPLQHWIIWRSTFDGTNAALRVARWRILGLISVVFVALFLTGSSDRLFGQGQWWSVVLVLVGASSALLGVTRGLLAAKGSYGAVAWVIGAENVFRLGIVIWLLNLSATPQILVASLAVGCVVLVPFIGSLGVSHEEIATPVRAWSEVGALAGATALAQVMVQFPPAFAEWIGESPVEVAALFATFSLGRAPLLVILSLSTRLTRPLTSRLQRPTEAVRRDLTVGIVLIFFSAALAAALGYAVGPMIVEWFFGPGRALGRADTAMIAGGLGLAFSGVVMILGLLALDENRRAFTYWLFAVVLAMGLSSAGTGIPAAFLIATAFAVACSAIALWRHQSRSPGSSE
jgi:O-antigen/teichoic acid export membrane protein